VRVEDPTPGELQRNIVDLRDRHNVLGQRLDTMSKDLVPVELYKAHLETTRREHDELGKDITDLSSRQERDHAELVARMDEERRQRSADKRLILMALWTSILAPVMLLLLSTYLRGKGASP
jgi:hypothetical protein